MFIEDFLKDLKRLQNSMLNTRAIVQKNKINLYRDYPHSQLDMILDHAQLLQEYNAMLDILFRIEINLNCALDCKKHMQVNDDDEIKKYLGVYYRIANDKYCYNKIPEVSLIRTAALMINPISNQLEFIINCNNKNWRGDKLHDKDLFISRGTLKKVRFGTFFEFSTYPLSQRVKISIKAIGDTYYNEQQALKKLGDICKFGVREAFGSTYIKNNSSKFETKIGFDMRARCDLFDYALSGSIDRTMYLIFAKIAHDLAIMHERKIAHCDIKPENILIDWQDDVSDPIAYITDLSTVVTIDNSVSSKMVTPTYSSPRSILRHIGIYSDIVGDDFYGHVRNVLSRKNMDLSQMQIEFMMSVFMKKSFEEWEKHLNMQDDPRKCDVWSLSLTYYFYINNNYATTDYDKVIESSPVLKVLLSIDDKFRPTAEEFLTIISAQYLIDVYGKETDAKLNEDLKYIGGIQGLYRRITKLDTTIDYLEQEKINQIVLDGKHTIYDKAKEILEKIIVNINSTLANNLPISSSYVTPIAYSYNTYKKERIATNEDDKPTKRQRELLMSNSCDCRIS